jgi:hypothetical protein
VRATYRDHGVVELTVDLPDDSRAREYAKTAKEPTAAKSPETWLKPETGN